MEKIKEFVAQFTEKFDFSNIQVIKERYFLADKSVNDVKNKIKDLPYSVGVFLGEKRKEFFPSPALIDLISKKSSRKVIVNKKAEFLFLCGRDVLDSGIGKCTYTDGLVLVQNSKDENLGYGEVDSTENKLIIKNILDKGAYLRMER
ncbi:MAG: hypothetical protein KKG59_04535 [Nanoarchaeota archaeon]|nr:hypothetical protein [Nanoarchaeota archaeon]